MARRRWRLKQSLYLAKKERQTLWRIDPEGICTAQQTQLLAERVWLRAYSWKGIVYHEHGDLGGETDAVLICGKGRMLLRLGGSGRVGSSR